MQIQTTIVVLENHSVCDCDRYVVAVGWDKRVNIYVDSIDDVRQVQEPLPHWPDDIVITSSMNVFLTCSNHSE